MVQTRHWCFTLNNWTAAEEDRLKTVSTSLTYIVFGYETAPTTGIQHLQGYVIFPRIKRLSEAKALLGQRLHLEPKRGTPRQASDYCKKDGLFFEHGELPASPGSSGQFDGYVAWLRELNESGASVPSDRQIAQAFPSLFVRYHTNLRRLANHLFDPPVMQEADQLRDWQRDLYAALVDSPPDDDRSILFYVDAVGGAGKSFFQRYMLSVKPDLVQVLSIGKRDDIAHAVDVSKNIFLFNIPRNGMQYLQYTILEMIKDRVIFSPKYDSCTKILTRIPHVVVFSNEFPDREQLTDDRFIVIDLNN